MRLIVIPTESSNFEIPDGAPPFDEVMHGVVEATQGMYARHGFELPWVAYLVLEEGLWVGTCAFRLPLIDSRVEIAYFTFPGFEGKGVGTKMARELIRMAFESGVVEEVFAYTMPEGNASTGILTKLGFVNQGEVQHPDDGLIWRWELRK